MIGSKALRIRQTSRERVAPVTPPPAGAARFSLIAPKLIVIGTSTGGPQALTQLLAALSPSLDSIPVLIVVHMPPAFTSIVAHQIGQATGRPSTPARHGEPAKPGRIYFAPGDKHLRVVKLGTELTLCHFDAPPENFCRPAVDVLFRTAAKACGPAVLGIVLTGMGVDGRDGARAIVAGGGSVIVQDEPSSVVWGMPGAVVREGLAAAMQPPEGIAKTVSDLLRGMPPRIAQ